MGVLLVLLLWMFGSVLVLASGSFLLYTLYIHYIHVKHSHIPGPKRKSFYLGNLPDLKKAIREERLPEDLFLDWAREHGNLLAFYVLHRVQINVFIPEVARELLVEKNYPKSAVMYRSLRGLYGQKFMGKSLITELDHESWKPLGDLFSPTFHRSFLKTCIPQFNSSCDLLLEELGKVADGKTEIHMLDLFNKVSLDCISKVAFSLDLKVFTNQCPFIGQLKFYTESIVQSFLSPLLWCNPLPSAKAYRQKTRAAAAFIRQIGRDCILARLEAVRRGEPQGKDILAHILQVSAGAEGRVTEDELEDMVNHFVTFFSAGQETTACLLASTLLELGRHPEIAYKVKTEADAVIGEDGYCSFDDLSSLKYTTAVLKESLRVHPPVAIISRQLEEEAVWNGVRVPKGSAVTVGIMNMGRLEEYFENPEEFMPSRFLGNKSYSHVHIPFSLGPRKCIGNLFAMIEARIIIAKLLKYFSFELVPGQTFHYVKHVTCKPKEGCLVYAKPLGPRPSSAA